MKLNLIIFSAGIILLFQFLLTALFMIINEIIKNSNDATPFSIFNGSYSRDYTKVNVNVYLVRLYLSLMIAIFSLFTSAEENSLDL